MSLIKGGGGHHSHRIEKLHTEDRSGPLMGGKLSEEHIVVTMAQWADGLVSADDIDEGYIPLSAGQPSKAPEPGWSTKT